MTTTHYQIEFLKGSEWLSLPHKFNRLKEANNFIESLLEENKISPRHKLSTEFRVIEYVTQVTTSEVKRLQT